MRTRSCFSSFSIFFAMKTVQIIQELASDTILRDRTKNIYLQVQLQ